METHQWTTGKFDTTLILTIALYQHGRATWHYLWSFHFNTHLVWILVTGGSVRDIFQQVHLCLATQTCWHAVLQIYASLKRSCLLLMCQVSVSKPKCKISNDLTAQEIQEERCHSFFSIWWCHFKYGAEVWKVAISYMFIWCARKKMCNRGLEN